MSKNIRKNNNPFLTLPVALIFAKLDGFPQECSEVIFLNRLPIAGEFIHLLTAGDSSAEGRMVRVLGLTHLSWEEASGPEVIAEVHCMRVRETAIPDSERQRAAIEQIKVDKTHEWLGP